MKPGNGRWWVAAIVTIVVAVVAVFAVQAILKTNGITRIHSGPGTATITWALPGGGITPPPKAFSGTVDGIALTGTAQGASPANVGTSPTGTLSLPAELHAARWTGTLGGTPFTLDVAESFGPGATPSSNGIVGGLSVIFHVTGTFGAQLVRVTAMTGSNNSGLLQFAGTVGNLRVTGTVSEPNENGRTGRVSASFDVSS